MLNVAIGNINVAHPDSNESSMLSSTNIKDNLSTQNENNDKKSAMKHVSKICTKIKKFTNIYVFLTDMIQINNGKERKNYECSSKSA